MMLGVEVGSGLEYVVLLVGTLAPSRYTSTVTRGLVTVEVTTTPGYSSRVAVTSIWQELPQELDARVELELGTELVLGVTVCKTVVGTSCVVVTRTEDITVDMMVDAGIWLVMICVAPG